MKTDLSQANVHPLLIESAVEHDEAYGKFLFSDIYMYNVQIMNFT